jgi:hypothetical protein
MLSKILDNSVPQYKMKSVIAKLLKSDKFIELVIATGYWDLPEMVEILTSLPTSFHVMVFHSVCNWVKNIQRKPIKSKNNSSLAPLPVRTARLERVFVFI